MYMRYGINQNYRVNKSQSEKKLKIERKTDSREKKETTKVVKKLTSKSTSKVSFFLGDQTVPWILRVIDHLEGCFMAYSNQWKNRRIHKRGILRRWFQSKIRILITCIRI